MTPEQIAQAHAHHVGTAPAPRQGTGPEARRVERAFRAFIGQAGQKAAHASISQVYDSDFNPLLERLQEELTGAAPQTGRTAPLLDVTMSPSAVEAARREAARGSVTHGQGATEQELEELRSAATDLAHAYALNVYAMLRSRHADFLATADRIKSAVLTRALVETTS